MDLHASWSGLDFSYLWWWTDKTVKPLSLPSLTLGLWHHEFRLRCVISTSSLWSTTPGSSLGVPMRLNPDRSRRFHNPVVKQPCVKDQVIYSVKFLSWPWGRDPWGIYLVTWTVRIQHSMSDGSPFMEWQRGIHVWMSNPPSVVSPVTLLIISDWEKESWVCHAHSQIPMVHLKFFFPYLTTNIGDNWILCCVYCNG